MSKKNFPYVYKTRCGYELIRHSSYWSYNGCQIFPHPDEKGHFVAMKNNDLFVIGYGLSQTCWLIDNIEKDRELYCFCRYMKEKYSHFKKPVRL